MVISQRRLRRRAAGVLIVGAVLAVTACGGDDASGTEGAPASGDGDAAAAGGGELTIANWQWLEPNRGDLLWSGVQNYEEVNPEATLVQSATPYSSYADALNTELGGGGGPDLMVMLDSQFATLAEAGLLVPLDDVVEGADLNSTNEAGVYEDQQLAVAWERTTYALIWNKSILEAAGVEPPTTVDELISAGQTIEAETGVKGIGFRHQIAEFDGWFMDYGNWTFGHGGSYSDGSELTLDTPENAEGIEAFKKVYDSGIVPIGDDMSTMRSKFAEGQLAMLIENSGGTESAAAALGGDAIGASALPFPEPGAHQQILIGVNANSDNKELAKDFIEWFVSEEGQTLSQPGHAANAMAIDLPVPAEFAAENPWAEVFLGLSPESRSPGIIPGFETDTKPIMRNFLEGVEQVLLQDADPAQVLSDVQQQSQQ